jgi:hypothetical protein
MYVIGFTVMYEVLAHTDLDKLCCLLLTCASVNVYINFILVSLVAYVLLL